jgi:hypothetical protein
MFDCLAQQALPHVVDLPAVRACNVVQHKPFDGKEANLPDLLSNHDILKAGVAVSTFQKSAGHNGSPPVQHGGVQEECRPGLGGVTTHDRRQPLSLDADSEA